MGKTSVINRYANNLFSSNYTHTTESNSIARILLTENGYINLKLWDIPQTKPTSVLTTVRFEHRNIFYIIYDVTKLLQKKKLIFEFFVFISPIALCFFHAKSQQNKIHKTEPKNPQK